MRIQCTLGKAIFTFKKGKLPARIDRILFLKTGALGDILMTTPLVSAIRQRFPSAIIDYACGRSHANILRGNTDINFIAEFDESIFFRKDLSEIRKLKSRLNENNYDVIFVLDKHWAFGLFASFCGKFRIGFDRNGEGFANNLNVLYKQKKHDIESYLDLGLYVRARADDKRMRLYLSRDDLNFAKLMGISKNTIAIAPGGGLNSGQRASLKVWPKEYYKQVVDEFTKKFDVVLIGGPLDRQAASWIRDHSKNKKRIRNLCGKTTIGQSASVMRRCRLVLCNDSGVMHLASCVNDNILSLFGPTDPRVLAPLNKGSKFIWKEEMACYDIFGKFGTCKKDMMKKISPGEVINAAKKFY